MKTTAYFVNMARGGLVDEEALAAALHAGEIAGAGLDTFEEEPKVSAALRAEPRAFLLPHIASATDETRFNMSERCACCQHRVRPTAAVFLSRALRFSLACTNIAFLNLTSNACAFASQIHRERARCHRRCAFRIPPPR